MMAHNCSKGQSVIDLAHWVKILIHKGVKTIHTDEVKLLRNG